MTITAKFSSETAKDSGDGILRMKRKKLVTKNSITSKSLCFKSSRKIKTFPVNDWKNV